ncbi:hypothetical protein OF83DRAFT_505612 [Amylostereum chailletii]|nr:hypothetical protein OF83DRAFT_505612 [Amylostereum chailletii]
MWATFVQDGCILAVVFIVAFIIPHYYDSASPNRHQRRQGRKHAIPTASEERECATHPVHQVAHSASVSPARHAGGPRRVGSKEIRSRDIRRAPEAYPILNRRPSPQTKPKSRGSVDRYDDPG